MSMLTLENHVRKLRFDQNIDIISLRKIFYDFVIFLNDANHEGVIKFLYLLPRRKGGLSVIGNALFWKDEKVCSYAKEILEKVETSPIGKKYIGQLNHIVRTKFMT